MKRKRQKYKKILAIIVTGLVCVETVCGNVIAERPNITTGDAYRLMQRTATLAAPAQETPFLTESIMDAEYKAFVGNLYLLNTRDHESVQPDIESFVQRTNLRDYKFIPMLQPERDGYLAVLLDQNQNSFVYHVKEPKGEVDDFSEYESYSTRVEGELVKMAVARKHRTQHEAETISLDNLQAALQQASFPVDYDIVEAIGIALHVQNGTQRFDLDQDNALQAALKNPLKSAGYDKIHEPVFSADGKYLAFLSDEGGKRYQNVVRLDGENDEALQAAFKNPLKSAGYAGIYEPVFSADGKYLAFLSDEGGKRYQNVVRLDGENDEALQAAFKNPLKSAGYAGIYEPVFSTIYNSVFSADGKYLTFQSKEGGKEYQNVVRLDGENDEALQAALKNPLKSAGYDNIYESVLSADGSI